MSDDFEKDDNLELNDEEQQLENDATGSESNDSEATNEPENESNGGDGEAENGQGEGDGEDAEDNGEDDGEGAERHSDYRPVNRFAVHGILALYIRVGAKPLVIIPVLYISGAHAQRGDKITAAQNQKNASYAAPFFLGRRLRPCHKAAHHVAHHQIQHDKGLIA